MNTSQYILVLLPKNPFGMAHKIVPESWRDLHRLCQKASELLGSGKVFKVIIPSAFQKNGISESNLYKNRLIDLGVSRDDIIVIDESMETVHQISIASRMARVFEARVIIVCTFLHVLRVIYLCNEQKLKAEIIPVFSIPKLAHALSDIILTIAMPLIDALGQRKHFLSWLIRCRSQGRFI